MFNTLTTSFLIGILGSMHCAGMCGGLVTTLSMGRSRVWVTGLMAYQFGRISTYTLLGMIAGIIGSVITGIAWFSQAQFYLSILAGIMMITFGLHIAGWMPDPFTRIISRFYKFTGLGQWVATARTSTNPASWYFVGALNGLLPCGLVYAALSLNLAVGNPVRSSVGMFLFGLGTIPSMMLVPVIFQKLTTKIRARTIKVAAMLVVLVGVVTMLRGTGLMHHLMHHNMNMQQHAAAQMDMMADHAHHMH